MPAYTVHPTTEKEAELLHRIVLESFAEYRDRLDPPSGVFKETVEAVARRILSGGGFIAAVDQIPVGAVLYEPREGYLYLGRLATLPDYRKRGIAKLLVSAVESAAIASGYAEVQLDVRIVLTANQALFKRLGFEIEGAYCHPGYSEPTYYTMCKRLPQ